MVKNNKGNKKFLLFGACVVVMFIAGCGSHPEYRNPSSSALNIVVPEEDVEPKRIAPKQVIEQQDHEAEHVDTMQQPLDRMHLPKTQVEPFSISQDDLLLPPKQRKQDSKRQSKRKIAQQPDKTDAVVKKKKIKKAVAIKRPEQVSTDKVAAKQDTQNSAEDATKQDTVNRAEDAVPKVSAVAPIVAPTQPVVVVDGSAVGSITLLGAGKIPISPNNVIVSVTPVDQALIKPRTPKSFEVAMWNKTYLPSHLVVQVGDSVKFKNLDPLQHHVFSSSPGNRFDLGTFPRGQKPGVVFENEGLVTVYCNLHRQMSTFIRVMRADRAMITGDDGTFFINKLPPGNYLLRGWHIRAEVVKPFVVTSGATVSFDITLDGSLYTPPKIPLEDSLQPEEALPDTYEEF